MIAKRVRDLNVYKKSFVLQQKIFAISKSFPKEEMYALTDQVRRSSRSIGANLSEAWAKRQYKNHFISKLTDSDAEKEETLHWIETAYACEYIAKDLRDELFDMCEHIGAMIYKMKSDAGSWCKHKVREESLTYSTD